ncbi:MAG TPA: hypothetical protein VGG30_02795, partial [Pirellulales bacterium]
RLKEPLTDELLATINDTFSDILSGGQFTQGAALPEEKEETDQAAHARLIFRFNRRSLGRLRQMIDIINRGGLDPRAAVGPQMPPAVPTPDRSL